MRLRLLADMGVSPRCVEWLRSQGYDAVHLYEQKLHTLSDSAILQKASDEKCVLLTVYLDFVKLVSAIGASDFSIVVIFRLHDYRPDNVKARLAAILPTIEHCAGLGQAILTVTDARVRIRQLPIG